MSELLVRKQGDVGHISLNRPKAIHALTLGMCREMTAALSEWAADDSVELVLLDHSADPAGDPKLSRGFCSGGDVALLRNSALNDNGESGREFFYIEYQLNHLMFEYAKPIIAFMDGIVMGGGVGISQPAKYRIATENTRFAMPETGIGLFPDVGGGWYLSRLAGRLGAFLATTGARLDGAECLYTELATHYVPSAKLPDLKANLLANPSEIDAVLADFSEVPPEPRIKANEANINRLFASDKLEDILAALAADPSDWAAKELATLKSKSPQACKVSLRQLVEASKLNSFADNMQMEYRIGGRVLMLPDFAEGVRALIVDKTNDASWNPKTPEAMTEDMLNSIFAPLPYDKEWKPL